MDGELGAVPVACSLSQLDLAERTSRWRALNDRAAPQVIETDRGLLLRYPAAPGVDTELAALAALERACCAFATWSVSTRAGLVELDIAAEGDEAIGAVRQMFADAR